MPLPVPADGLRHCWQVSNSGVRVSTEIFPLTERQSVQGERATIVKMYLRPIDYLMA